MSTDRRDQSIERLLRAMPGDNSSGGSSACLDAETLAAWADEHLQGPARARAESHAASCARCQALLAAMIRTADVPSALIEDPARSRSWISRMAPWLAPLTAAAAAAVVVWVAVMPRFAAEPPAVPPVASAPAVVETPKETAAASAPALHAAQQNQVPDSRTPSPESRGQSTESRPAAPPVAGRTANARADAVSDKRVAPQRDQDRRERTGTKAADAAVPGTVGARPAASAPAPPPLAAVGDPKREAGQFTARSAAVSEGVLAGRVTSSSIDIASPDPKVRWRIIAGSLLQQTADEGKTWTTQPISVEVTLTAGSAPSPSVAWVVGHQGTVLLTTDARTWQRVSFPEAVDLVSVKATSGEAATVTAADGRLFVTVDGGKTWKR